MIWDNMNYNNGKDKLLLKKIKTKEFRPIFIQGLARSGTSLIYNLLSSTNCFNYLTYYHTKFYDEILYNHINNNELKRKNQLDNEIKKLKIDNRGIDHLKINSNSPEEYQFILLNKSRFRKINTINYFLINEICQKILFISENDKPILLKNPNDFNNFLYIKNKYPQAKFIFIHRNPFRILISKRKAIKQLYESKGSYYRTLDYIYNNIYSNSLSRFIIRRYHSDNNFISLLSTVRAIIKSIEIYMNDIKNLSKEDYINVRYEDICTEPNENIDKILNFLSLKFDKKKDFETKIKQRDLVYSNIIDYMNNYLYNNLQNYYNKYNYDNL